MGVTVSGMERVARRLKKLDNLSKPVNSATKRTLIGAKTEASKAIRDEVALKKSYVDKGLNGRATYLSENGKGEASIEVSAQKRGALMRNYLRSYNKKSGALIMIKRGNPQRIKRAFFINLKNGVKTIVWRKEGEKGRSLKSGAFVLHGPSPSQVLDTKRDEVAAGIAARFEKNLDHALSRHLK